MTRADLSCDLGEASNAEERATELALWPLVDGANVACGGHAGDDASMREAAALARRHGVRLGAHPSFPDREGFGRKKIEIADEELVASLARQIGSLRAIAAGEGIRLERVKAHGALYNLAHRDAALARLLARAVAEAAPEAAIVSPAGSTMEIAARERGLAVMREAFADRRYLADGALVPRSDAGALLEDPAEAAAQAVSLATRGTAIAIDGREIAVPHDTLCIHSDMRGAVERLRSIRAALAAAGVALSR
jgi:UPF0271 protein